MSAIIAKSEHIPFSFHLTKEHMLFFSAELEAMGGRVDYRAEFAGTRASSYRKIGDIFQEAHLHPRPLRTLEMAMTKGSSFVTLEFTTKERITGQIRIVASIEEEDLVDPFERIDDHIEDLMTPYSLFWELSPASEALVAAIVFMPLALILVQTTVAGADPADRLPGMITTAVVMALAFFFLTALLAGLKSTVMPMARLSPVDDGDDHA